MSLSSLAQDGIVYSPFRDSAVAAGAAAVNRNMGAHVFTRPLHLLTVCPSVAAALTFLAWDIAITMDDEVCCFDTCQSLP